MRFSAPTGFDWITGHHEVAPIGSSECVLTLSADNGDDVNDTVRRAQAAGAELVAEPGQQPWGYAGTFADPDGHIWMVRSQ